MMSCQDQPANQTDGAATNCSRDRLERQIFLILVNLAEKGASSDRHQCTLVAWSCVQTYFSLSAGMQHPRRSTPWYTWTSVTCVR